MKLQDFDSTIDILDSEAVDIIEKLDKTDKTSAEYTTMVENLERLQQAKNSEMRTRSEYLNSKLPSWAVSLIGTAISVLAGGIALGTVLHEERNDGVVSSQAISLWDKVVRKF